MRERRDGNSFPRGQIQQGRHSLTMSPTGSQSFQLSVHGLRLWATGMARLRRCFRAASAPVALAGTPVSAVMCRTKPHCTRFRKQLLEDRCNEHAGGGYPIGSRAEIHQDDDGRLLLGLIEHKGREPLNGSVVAEQSIDLRDA